MKSKRSLFDIILATFVFLVFCLVLGFLVNVSDGDLDQEPKLPTPKVTVEPSGPTKPSIGKLTKVQKAGPTPVGVQVLLSDGTVTTYPLGIWLEFQNGILRGVFPSQYVNQNATLQSDGSWKYSHPGRNVQIWRNGILQREKVDYTLDQSNARIIPIPYPDMVGNIIGWNTDDYVTASFLY